MVTKLTLLIAATSSTSAAASIMTAISDMMMPSLVQRKATPIMDEMQVIPDTKEPITNDYQLRVPREVSMKFSDAYNNEVVENMFQRSLLFDYSPLWLTTTSKNDEENDKNYYSEKINRALKELKERMTSSETGVQFYESVVARDQVTYLTKRDDKDQIPFWLRLEGRSCNDSTIFGIGGQERCWFLDLVLSPNEGVFHPYTHLPILKSSGIRFDPLSLQKSYLNMLEHLFDSQKQVANLRGTIGTKGIFLWQPESDQYCANHSIFISDYLLDTQGRDSLSTLPAKEVSHNTRPITGSLITITPTGDFKIVDIKTPLVQQMTSVVNTVYKVVIKTGISAALTIGFHLIALHFGYDIHSEHAKRFIEVLVKEVQDLLLPLIIHYLMQMGSHVKGGVVALRENMKKWWMKKQIGGNSSDTHEVEMDVVKSLNDLNSELSHLSSSSSPLSVGERVHKAQDIQLIAEKKLKSEMENLKQDYHGGDLAVSYIEKALECVKSHKINADSEDGPDDEYGEKDALTHTCQRVKDLQLVFEKVTKENVNPARRVKFWKVFSSQLPIIAGFIFTAYVSPFIATVFHITSPAVLVGIKVIFMTVVKKLLTVYNMNDRFDAIKKAEEDFGKKELEKEVLGQEFGISAMTGTSDKDDNIAEHMSKVWDYMHNQGIPFKDAMSREFGLKTVEYYTHAVTELESDLHHAVTELENPDIYIHACF